MLDCLGKGITHFVIISAGFKETGDDEGRLRERSLSDIVARSGIRIVGPNCLGIFDNISGVDTFFLPRNLIQRPRKGCVSIASQSGSFVGHLMDLASTENLGIARVITYGNRVDVAESDALDFFSRDPSSKVIGVYVEGVSDGSKFLKGLEAASENGKPVVALKAGKYESLSSAITSHTGAIAGSYSAYGAAFRKTGVTEVDSLEEFIDTCKGFSLLRRAEGNRVLILGHAGGLGLALADSCISSGLVVPKLSAYLRKRVSRVTLPFATITNPIDLTASGTDDQAESVLNLCLKDSGFDMAIYLALWGLPQSTERIGEIVSNSMRESEKPIVVATLSGKACIERRHVFEDLGVPVFPSIGRAARVAAHLPKSVSRQS